MRAETVQALLRAKPFKPFRVHMSDGSAYEVKHPEIAFLTRDYLEVGVDAIEGIPDHAVRCALMHISRIEDLLKAGKGRH